jgi:hypothetical protein
MSERSKTARAAAVLVFTSGVDGFDQAVELYDEMANSDEPLDALIDKYPGVCRWSQLDHLDEIDWWEEVTTLADVIDEARKHFKE